MKFHEEMREKIKVQGGLPKRETKSAEKKLPKLRTKHTEHIKITNQASVQNRDALLQNGSAAVQHGAGAATERFRSGFAAAAEPKHDEKKLMQLKLALKT
ncbi:uncharacterized protein G2W53_004468 [Senna tora]|uniref:Uncharacterized protein n=1 Tax=Senna tora TaxID=362788 RepID=A0A834XBQ0_9FABA|nr:uncharacterized protein G2W53_004468 [Senna tora]